jgi:catechol 1,2-dioxygenase
VTTHLFDAEPVPGLRRGFGVKESLVWPMAWVDDPAPAAALRLPNPFRSVEFDITLLAAD